MGLGVSHDCWHGPYSSFMRWREKLCQIAGYGDIHLREYFGGDKPWPADDPLVVLLAHSDCEGEIEVKDCKALADAIEELLPGLKRAGDDDWYLDKAEKFIAGLRRAAELNENVDFH